MKIIRANDLDFVPPTHEVNSASTPMALKRVLATANDLQAGQVMMVNWAKLAIGGAFREHYHEDMQEIFVVVEGRAVLWIDGNRFELMRGDAAIIDANEKHRMENIADEEVEFIALGIASGTEGRTIVTG